MILIKVIQILTVSILLFSCKTDQTEKTERTENKKIEITSDKIILIFKSSPKINDSYQFSKSIIINPEFTKISVFGSEDDKSIDLSKIKTPNNITLKTEKNNVIFRHYINYIDYNDYVLMKGDSVSIDYQDGLPLVSILNRKTLKNDYNAEDIVRNSYFNKGYSPIAEYFNARTLNAKKLLAKGKSLNSKSSISIEQRQEIYNQQIDAIKNELYSSMMLFLDRENSILDSLKENQLISYEPYNYYKNKIKIINYIVSIETGRIFKNDIRKVMSENWEKLNNYPSIYHQQLIESFTDKFIAIKAKIIEIGDGRNRDFRQVYAIVDTTNMFSENDKSYLLYRELKKIAETFSNEDFISYFKKYESTVSDTMLINKVKSEYSVKFSKSANKTSSLVLLTDQGKEFSFDEVKERHIGKILYVDFWASWCIPCRTALPQSIEIRNELKDKKIVFVYLSIDQKIKPWQMASQKDKLHNYRENYLIANYSTSEFIKQQKLSSIPRYMIFNKRGKLIYANAPQVLDKELKSLLIKLSTM